MEIKKNNDVINLIDFDVIVETYDFNKAIDFSRLTRYLIKCDFERKIVLEDKIENKTEQERNLFDFIKRIIDDYNSKVDMYNTIINDSNSNYL